MLLNSTSGCFRNIGL